MKRLAFAGVSSLLVMSALVSPHVLAVFTPNAAVVQGAITSAVLQPPTSLAATGGCRVLVLGPQVTLNWTATTSTFATGYNIYRSATSGGPYTLVVSVPGRTTTTYADTTVTGLSTTYYYVMRATFQNWTSVQTTQASGVTPLLCL